MALYKIGITEAGDAGLDLSWVDKLNSVDGAILITKRISPKFYDNVLVNKDKIIIHATLTGFGGTILEPFVPYPYEEFDSIMALIKAGFPKEKIVIRIDPIIPTHKGIETALNVFKDCMDSGFKRFRVSIIDMYPHVRERLIKNNLPLPYGNTGFYPSKEQIYAVDNMLKEASEYWKSSNNSDDLRIEACAEPELNRAIQCGCISNYDIKLFGLQPDTESNNVGYQRKNCMCYSGKIELLKHKSQCPHECLYCYWKS